MVMPLLCRRQSKSAMWTTLLSILLCGCHSWPGGIYRSPLTDRVIEFKSGTAYITEGRSTQAIAYVVKGDRVVLQLPFTNEVLQRMPDGTLSGMGERLVKFDPATSALMGTYTSKDGEYALRFSTSDTAIYTSLGRPVNVTFTVHGNRIILQHGETQILVIRHPDGSLETPSAILRKDS
jgi:hypothetical protein